MKKYKIYFTNLQTTEVVADKLMKEDNLHKLTKGDVTVFVFNFNNVDCIEVLDV